MQKQTSDSFMHIICPVCNNKMSFKKQHVEIGFLYGEEVFVIDCELCESDIVLNHHALHTL